MALPRWISVPAGQAARTVGRTYDYATPGSGTSTLTNVGRAINDPNVTLRTENLGTGRSVFQPVPSTSKVAIQGGQPSANDPGDSTFLNATGPYNTTDGTSGANRQAQIDFINRGYDTKLAGLQGQLETLTPA